MKSTSSTSEILRTIYDDLKTRLADLDSCKAPKAEKLDAAIRTTLQANVGLVLIPWLTADPEALAAAKAVAERAGVVFSPKAGAETLLRAVHSQAEPALNEIRTNVGSQIRKGLVKMHREAGKPAARSPRATGRLLPA